MRNERFVTLFDASFGSMFLYRAETQRRREMSYTAPSYFCAEVRLTTRVRRVLCGLAP